MKIENIEVFGFRSALRGMRNPMNSWDRSDTRYSHNWINGQGFLIGCPDYPNIGPEDLKLACKLIKGGSEHRKFLRQIQIWFDITIPRYVWQEKDTYKVATVRNSCSTMHKLGSKDLTQEDFELPIPSDWLRLLNFMGKDFRLAKENKDTALMNEIRREYKNLLPEGFLQKATYTMNYETALTMYFQRRNHRLPEWRADKEGSICSFIAHLPYMEEFINAREE
jgi:hypothetical protein